MSDKVRTRFAPSPTGFLHIGGARTALFAWLYARHHQGEFVLRIEDTDQQRSTPEMSQQIIQAMEWLGLSHDGEVVYQSDRRARYAEAAEQLLDEGKAYRCYCTKEELAALREQQLREKRKPRYDGRCRTRTTPREGVEPVIRFANPDDGSVVFNDCVHGRTEVSNKELDDLVIMRADGMPTYNFCVVVDDMDMQISHVLRGDDHLSNTPRQINIWHAFGATPPEYAHLPMILDASGKRMSKRDGAASLDYYREQGYLPQALRNYLLRLGWSHGDQEIFSLEEMIALFNLTAVSHASAALNPAKLDWLNAHYLNEMPIEALAEPFTTAVEALGCDVASGIDPKEVLPLLRERHKTLSAIAQGARFLYCDEIDQDQSTFAKYSTPEVETLLKAVLLELEGVQQWNEDTMKQAIGAVLSQSGVKMGQLGKPLRFILTGGAPSPGLALTLEWIGKARTIARLRTAIARISESLSATA